MRKLHLPYRLFFLMSIGTLFSFYTPKNKPLNNGDQFPLNIKVQSIEGDTLLIGVMPEIKNKLLLVEFWASWCGKCLQQSSSLQSISSDFKNTQFENGSGLKFVTISLDKDKAKWTNFLISKQYPNALNVRLDSGWKSEYVQSTGVAYLPYTFVIDQDGKILSQGLFGTSLRKKLDSFAKK